MHQQRIYAYMHQQHLCSSAVQNIDSDKKTPLVPGQRRSADRHHCQLPKQSLTLPPLFHYYVTYLWLIDIRPEHLFKHGSVALQQTSFQRLLQRHGIRRQSPYRQLRMVRQTAPSNIRPASRNRELDTEYIQALPHAKAQVLSVPCAVFEVRTASDIFGVPGLVEFGSTFFGFGPLQAAPRVRSRAAGFGSGFCAAG